MGEDFKGMFCVYELKPFTIDTGIEKCISKVIFEKEYCIIVDNFGNRYISKPEKGEKYDKEKGLLVALAKYNGFTTTRVQDLIKSAVVKNGKKSSRNKKQPKKN